MPSFVCDRCQETLKKPKLDQHAQRCRGASFSCIDCYKSFRDTDYRAHFSCITETEKYVKRKPAGVGVGVGVEKRQGEDGQTVPAVAPADTNTSDRGSSRPPHDKAVGLPSPTDMAAKRSRVTDMVREVVRNQEQASADLQSVLRELKKKRGLSKRHLLKRIVLHCAPTGKLSLSLHD